MTSECEAPGIRKTPCSSVNYSKEMMNDISLTGSSLICDYNNKGKITLISGNKIVYNLKCQVFAITRK